MPRFNIFHYLTKRETVRALKRLQSNDDFLLLEGLELFKGMSPGAMLMIMERLVERRYSRGETVFEEGQPGICCFILKEGQVQIFAGQGNGDSKVILANLTRGALFGEIAVTSEHHRMSSAESQENGTVLLSLSMFDLSALEKEFPKDAVHLYKRFNYAIVKEMLVNMSQLQKLKGENARLKEQLSSDEER